MYGLFSPYFDRHEEYYESGVALGETGLFSPDAEGLQAQAWRGPVYPAFIALVEAGFREPWPGHVAVAQALLSTAGVAAVAALAFLLGGIPAALFAAAFAAFDPAQIFAVSRLSLHGFYGLTILALAAAAALRMLAPKAASSAPLGLTLAGTLMCRPSHFLAVPFLALFAARRPGVRVAAAVLLWTALGLLPWTIRNAARLGDFTPLNVGGGSYSLLAASQGRTDAASVSEGLKIAEGLQPGFNASHSGPEEVEDAMRALAYRVIAKRPGRYFAGCLRRLFQFWKPLWPLVILAALAFSRSRSDALYAVGLVAVSFSAYAAIGVHSGYELGVAPVLDVLAGCGAAALLARAGRSAKKIAADATLTERARRALIAWVGLLLALTAGIQVWAVADAFRARRPEAAYTGPRVLSVLKTGSVMSGGRWRKSVTPEELRAKPLRNEGVRLFMNGHVESSVGPFRAAVAASPRSAQDQLNLCVALGRLGRRREALSHCEEAVKLARDGDPELLENALSSLESIR
ncbi:MAG: hypothetical protein COV48_13045 [Elusimicrobia bacterium CG11_big_fil_rev_8_21_14_0_20_64_6]|nr:MAG: hypothetical protein COV48_13045 [Elusimicrobia bacterium CG11_big_fil_rev_8_21_14_0_20_64_6]